MTDVVSKRLPAEWEPQAAVLMAWPHERTDWKHDLEAAEAVFTAIIDAITDREPVVLLCHAATELRAQLAGQGLPVDRIRFVEMPYDDTWTRDYGPITIYEDRRPVLLKFRFNGWGGKFASAQDNAAVPHLAESGALRGAVVRAVDYTLEGGSIDSDGCGTVLTTARCLLNETRNGPTDRGQVEQRLRGCFGADRVLWLEHGGLEGDDTDGHVDMLARFCDPATIAYMKCTDDRDPHFAALEAMEAELKAFKRLDGGAYRLIDLPWPEARFHEGHRLPLSYANFLIINEAVLVPAYGVAEDLEAVGALLDAFPDRDVISIDCSALVRQGGSLHCSTMQLPKGVIV